MLTDHQKLPARDTDAWQEVNGVWVPRVGVGASHGYGSDSYPYTIIRVSRTGHQLVLLPDSYRVVSGTFQTGDAVCEYSPGEHHKDAERIATRRHGEVRCANCGSISRTVTALTVCDRTLGCRDVKQRWLPVYKMKGANRKSPSISVGYRRYYQDPHF